MSQAATYIRNGVHPRRLVELYLGEPEAGSGELEADFGKAPPEPTGGYIDTRPPLKGDRPFREANNIKLLNGQMLPVWIAYVARGPRVSLLYAIKHPDQKPQVVEMDRRAAKLLTSRFPILGQNKPTLVVAMPSSSWQAEHFAQEVAKAADLPLQTGVFNKTGSIKGTHFAKKQQWARANIKLVDHTADFEGQSIALVDDNFGSGASMGAAAELLYARGAAYVIGLATFRITGKKDPDEPDVGLGYAKEITALAKTPETPEEAPNPNEAEDDEAEGQPVLENARDRAALLERALKHNEDSLPTFTATELAEIYDVSPVEMRFTLSVLGLAKLVKPG